MNFVVSESQRDSSFQPRVARHELPWVTRFVFPQPQRGCITIAMKRCNPVGVEDLASDSQGSRSSPVRLGPPTLGWMTLPRWGNQTAPRAIFVTGPRRAEELSRRKETSDGGLYSTCWFSKLRIATAPAIRLEDR
jgi:hypothetical protein